MLSVLAEIPSPTQGVWFLMGVPIRAYALCILAGVLVAIWLGNRRWVARGGQEGFIADTALWAVPLGIVGARTYHVLSHPADYFGADKDLLDVFKIWEGGIAIFGGLLAGSLTVWWITRRHNVSFPSFLAAVAPGVLLAQALGRWGNYFNNELYGGATDVPWALKVYQWDLAQGQALRDADGQPIVLGTFHPTFLYESLWTLSAAVLLLVIERKFRFAAVQTIGTYLVLYGSGRFWIENMRSDFSEYVLGLRTNAFTALLAVLVGGGLLWWGRTQQRPWRVSAAEPAVADEAQADSADAADGSGQKVEGSAGDVAAPGQGQDTAAQAPQAAATKATAKKSASKKSAAEKSAAETPAKKTATKAAAKKTATKAATAATAAKKTTAKKTAAKAVAKKTAAQKTAAKKTAAKKTAAKKTAAKKTADEA